MARNYRALRGGAVLVGVGALLAAAATPGAVAQSTSQAQASITRAVLTQANANNTDVSRSTLVTQVQVDGQGDLSFTVPVVEGSSPSNMDTFGGPTVENGEAVYDISVDGPETFRTAQDYPYEDIPIDLTVTAKLDGKAIDVTDLSEVSGEVELTYTAENLTSTPSTLVYQNGNGDTVEEDVDLVTSMGGTLEITFPPSWSNVQSKDATVVSGDGSGETLVSGSFTLMEPFGTPKQSFKISANVDNGNMPPAVLQFTVLEPKNNPTARSIAESLKGGVTSGQSIFGAGKQLDAGATQLIDGLTTAVDGAGQLSAGLNDQLVPGVNELVAGLEDLPATVTSSSSFDTVTEGFATLDAAVGGVAQKLGVFNNTGAGQFLTANGDIDKAKTTVARTIWALIYGVRAVDTPANSPGKVPNTNTGGLTNPACDLRDPESPSNPCGAWQVIDAVSKSLSTGLPTAVGGINQAKGAIDTQILPGVKLSNGGVQQVSAGLSTQAIPGLQQIQGGLDSAYQQLISTTPPSGGAYGITALAGLLGCQVKAAAPGVTGPIVNGAIACAGATQGANVAAVLEGITNSIYKPADPANPPNSGLAALLGQVLAPATGSVITGLNGAVAGLGQVSGGLTQVEGGLGQVSAGLGQVSAGLSAAGSAAPAALNKLLPVITTNPSGNPDPSTANGNTATGILNELRAALGQGGVGTNGVPGQCAGYNTPGNPSSGLNTNASQAQILATCAAADVLNLALLVSDALETGVSTTLLEGISDQLVTSVQPLVVGANKLADGSSQLAAGLPAAVDGVGQIKTDAAGGLKEAGNDAAEDFGRRVALYEAMNNPDLVSKYIPGGAPQGDDISYNGVYKFELAGVGSESNSTTTLALAVLGLAAAAGVGAFAGSRAKAA